MTPKNKIILRQVEKWLDREMGIYNFKIKRYGKEKRHPRFGFKPLWRIVFLDKTKKIFIICYRKGRLQMLFPDRAPWSPKDVDEIRQYYRFFNHFN